jgi:hypothetical protein
MPLMISICISMICIVKYLKDLFSRLNLRIESQLIAEQYGFRKVRNRVFKIDGNDKYYSMSRGVCQGSALGPLLFSLYINSVGSCFTSPFVLYADDLYSTIVVLMSL